MDECKTVLKALDSVHFIVVDDMGLFVRGKFVWYEGLIFLN